MRLNVNKGSVILLLAAAFFSCKKEEKNNTTTTQTPKEILMASQWKKSEYKENGTVVPFFASCEMDDVLSFNATNWVLDGGGTQCSGAPQTATDFYVVEADNKTMRWTYGTGELTFNSTKTAFTFKRTGANTFEYTFVKK